MSQIVTFEGIAGGVLPVVLAESFSLYVTRILKYLTTLSIYCSRPVCCLIACRSVAVVLNKIEKGSTFERCCIYIVVHVHPLYGSCMCFLSFYSGARAL